MLRSNRALFDGGNFIVCAAPQSFDATQAPRAIASINRCTQKVAEPELYSSPMRFIRTLLVLLLCAMLPLSGLAASGLAGPCPMQTAIATSGSADTSMQAMPGCEGMKSPAAGHGKPGGTLCKMTAQCMSGSLYHPVSLPVLSRPAGRVSALRFHYAQACPARSPDGLWRPPRAL